VSTLRLRLVTVIALALVGGVVSQSVGAGSADARPHVSGLVAAGVVPEWPGARRIPVPSGVRAASQSTALRRAALRSLAEPSTFTNIGGVDLGDDESVSVYGATWADYDSDGKPDLLTIGANSPPDYSTPPTAFTKLYHGNGDGTFSENKATGLPALWGGVASWADYDSDGRLDVLIAGCTDAYCSATVSKLYRNNGDGSFSEDTSAGLAGVVTADSDAITWTDYDLDGRPDVLLTGIGNYGFFINGTSASSAVEPELLTKLYHNNGDGSFSENTNAQLSGLYLGMSAWSDYDADGFPDLLLNGIAGLTSTTSAASLASPTSLTKLYHNNGDGTFSENTAAQLPATAGGWIAWGDYDGDGFADILINGSPAMVIAALDSPTDSSAGTRLYRNNGDGTFTENTTSGLPDVGNAQLIWGDYDGDGRLDVALNGCLKPCTYSSLAGPSYVTELYRNNGDGTFSKDESAGLPADFAWFAAGDYNSDNRLDLLLYDTSTLANAGLYRNDAAVAAAAPDSPVGLESHLIPKSVVRLSWDESSSKTLLNSVTYNLRVGTAPGAGDVVSALAGPSGVRQLFAYGNAEGRNFAKLKILRPGTYYWSVQAVGANYAGSYFAPEHEFVIPAKATLRLLRSHIFACTGGPRTTKVFGSVRPGYFSAFVSLQRRFARGAGWRAVTTRKLTSRGNFSFAKVGKGVKRSFWLRVRVRSKLGTVVSRPAHVYVKGVAACTMPKKSA